MADRESERSSGWRRASGMAALAVTLILGVRIALLAPALLGESPRPIPPTPELARPADTPLAGGRPARAAARAEKSRPPVSAPAAGGARPRPEQAPPEPAPPEPELDLRMRAIAIYGGGDPCGAAGLLLPALRSGRAERRTRDVYQEMRRECGP